MLEPRKLGRSDLVLSEIGFHLMGAPDSIRDLSRRAAAQGCRFIYVDDPGLISAAKQDGVVVGSPSAGDWVLETFKVAACRDPRAIPSVVGRQGLSGVAVPFSFADQHCVEHLSGVRRAGLGVVGLDPLPETGNRAMIASLVRALAPLVKPGRSFFQVAIQFALANQHLDCVLVKVDSVRHLEEALAAPESEPLEIHELEKIFETYAHRYDEDPGVGCGPS